MIPALIFGLALAAIGTVVILCAVRLTDPEPTDLPVIAESRRELAADPLLRWCADTEAVEAFLTLPEQRSASRWS